MLRKRHILVIGRILILLLFVANSGFTMVLHTCAMSTMACCADAMPASKAPAPPMSEAALAGSEMQCCTVIVAGGVNATPVAMEHSSTDNPQKFPVRAEVPALTAPADLQAFTSSILAQLSSRSAVAPRSVEKYVLNAVFLI